MTVKVGWRFRLLALSVWIGSLAHGAAAPNILMITADDLGLQLGCYGDSNIVTPHLDALASQGRAFE